MIQKKIIPAVRTDNITYAVRDIVVLANEVAKSGKEMLYLNIGDPNIFDFKPPAHLVKATYDAMLKNYNGYAPSSGISEAVESIEREAEKKGINNVHDIFVTTGASEAIDVCLTALVNDGENVLTPSPGYPLYTAIASKLSMMENAYYLDEDNGWLPDIDGNSTRSGALLGGYYHLNEHFKVGVGYNFTDFDDDLREDGYENRGWFLDLIGKY